MGLPLGVLAVPLLGNNARFTPSGEGVDVSAWAWQARASAMAAATRRGNEGMGINIQSVWSRTMAASRWATPASSMATSMNTRVL